MDTQYRNRVKAYAPDNAVSISQFPSRNYNPDNYLIDGKQLPKCAERQANDARRLSNTCGNSETSDTIKSVMRRENGRDEER